MDFKKELIELAKSVQLEQTDRTKYFLYQVERLAYEYAKAEVFNSLSELFEQVKEADGDAYEIHNAFCDAMDVEFSYGQ